MALHLSDSSEKLSGRAKSLSEQWKHGFLSTEHYFMASCIEDPVCESFLSQCGFTIDEFEEIILEWLSSADDHPLWEGMTVSPRLKRILDKNASKEAEKCKAMRVEPKHFVVAILKDQKGLVCQILLDQGLDPKILAISLANDQPVKGGRSASGGSSARGSSSKKGEEKKSSGKEKFLSKYTRDLTQMAREKRFDPVVGRADEIRRVMQTLTRKTKSNPVLIGEAGVGKTAIASGLAMRIASGKVPDALKSAKVLELSLPSMLSGAKHRGEFEERLEGVVKEAMEDMDIVLFIDEIHMLVGAGDSRGGMDASNILKPKLARGELKVMGATTTDEYRRYIEQDPALERRFQPVLVPEPSEEDAVTILRGLKEKYEEHHGVVFEEKAIIASVKLSVRYLPDRNLPDKAIDLLDEAAARVKTSSHVFEAGKPIKLKVSDEVVAEVVSDWTGIPARRMTQEESERLLEMEEILSAKVIGQDHAVTAVAQTIRVVRMGLAATDRPSGVFLFCGPSGVGKTELAKVLAEFLFGSSSSIVRLDMSEFHDKHSMARLIGAPPGYVGFDEEGQLTGAVRTNPYSVVLMDEVEKAHPEIFDLFLQVFDDGRLTDSKGRVINFTNTIIVMTSNLGAKEAAKADELIASAGQIGDLPKSYQNALKTHFRPEFLNRIDELVAFKSLERSDLVTIAKIHVEELKKNLFDQREVELIVSGRALEFLLQHGYQPEFGARPLQRAVTTYLARPLAEEMLRNQWSEGSVVEVGSDGVKLLFRLAPRSSSLQESQVPKDEGPGSLDQTSDFRAGEV